MSLEEEELWLPIPGYANYEVSDMGHVRSLDREVTFVRRGRPVLYRYKGKIITPTIAKTGYPVVGLGNKKIHLVHRLVLLAFVGDAPAGCLCAHGDGTRNNNRLSNLRWTTQLDNSHDRIAHGTNLSGENHPRSKLTAQQVSEIRALHGKMTQPKIAKMFSVCIGTVSMILSGKIWKGPAIMTNMLLHSLELRTEDYGAQKGQMHGKAKFKNGLGEVTININPEKASKILAILAEEMVSTAQDVARMMTAQIVDQANDQLTIAADKA